LLDLIADFRDEQGYCPSYEEIAHGCNWHRSQPCTSTSPALEHKGYLKRGFTKAAHWS